MHISHFVIVLNSSVNFYIYCLTHLNVLEQVRKCFGKRAKYVRTRYASVSQSISTRRLSALTSLQTRNKSCSNSNLSEKAHNTRLQSIMEGMRESVTMPMLSSHLNTEDESDDEWWSNLSLNVYPYLWFDKESCLDLLHSVLYVICNTRNFGYHSGNKLMNYELCGNKKCNKNLNIW